MRSVCVQFCAIIPCVALFEALFVSLSHPTRSAYLSERKEASLVCHDIKKNEFKEYVGNTFFVCVCVCVLFLFSCALTRFFPARNEIR